MEILSLGAAAGGWTTEVSCGECGARLRVGLGDIRVREGYDGLMGRYEITCGACGGACEVAGLPAEARRIIADREEG